MRKEFEKKILVGINQERDIVYLDYIFWDGEGFHGASGIRLEYKTKEEAESEWDDAEENPTDYVDRDLWVEAVKYDRTDESYEDWATSVIQEERDTCPWPNADGSNTNFVTDEDEKKIKDIFDEEDELVYSWCGCGRCFNSDDEYETVFEPELVKIIAEFEQENMTEERADELFKKLEELYGKD